jgi:hypothetical protein
MTQSIAPKNGLLTPEESVPILIDHQPCQFAKSTGGGS